MKWIYRLLEKVLISVESIRIHLDLTSWKLICNLNPIWCLCVPLTYFSLQEQKKNGYVLNRFSSNGYNNSFVPYKHLTLCKYLGYSFEIEVRYIYYILIWCISWKLRPYLWEYPFCTYCYIYKNTYHGENCYALFW